MVRPPTPRVLIQASEEVASRVGAALLAEGCAVSELETGDWLEQLETGAACLVLDLPSLESLPTEIRARFGELRSRAPLVVVGCADAAEAERAVESGAALSTRADASDEELRCLLRGALKMAALARDCRQTREELRRHAALVMKDDLTAAFNRRFFERCLDEEIERARRFQASVSLIFMDIDNLRDVNQAHGHAMGSLVLREAAARTIRTIRSIDKCVRYGGDEFCVVLPETDWRGALEVAERIRGNFAGRPFLVEDDEIVLTASFGVASYPEHAGTKAELIKAADEAMFAVKDDCKNGIIVAQERSR